MEDKFQLIGVQNDESEKISSPRYSYWKSVFRCFFSSKVAIFMLFITIVICMFSFIHPVISGYNHQFTPYINDSSKWYLYPSLENWFGTDNIGRDLFGSVWAGTRTSLTISLSATFISAAIGIIVGAFWGYSKKIDLVMLEVYNVVANIPFTLLVLVIMYILGPGVGQMIFAMCVTSWLGMAYFIRIQVMIIRDREYNLASRCLGTPMYKIILHNVLPFLISVIVTSISRDVPAFISLEVFLSFLGVGLPKTVPSLGGMIDDYAVHMTSQPSMFWIPVCVSALMSISLYIVGQALADASDPKTHMV